MKKVLWLKDLDADKMSYNLTGIKLENEVIGRNFFSKRNRGATFRLTLFFYAYRKFQRALNLVNELSEVCFRTKDFDYDCHLESVNQFVFENSLLTIELSFDCEVYGKSYEVDLRKMETLYVQSEKKTALNLEVKGRGIVEIGKNRFEIEEGQVLEIDSLEMTVKGGTALTFYDWYYGQGEYPLTLKGEIEEVKVRYRTAYVVRE